jgi:hypothetical protein
MRIRLARHGVLLGAGPLLAIVAVRDCRSKFVVHLRWRSRSKMWRIRNPFWRWDESKGGPRA